MKQYGIDLKKDLVDTERKLSNIKNAIDKRFVLLLDNYRSYLTDEDKKYILIVGINDLDIDKKLSILINTEANYVKQTANQGELF